MTEDENVERIKKEWGVPYSSMKSNDLFTINSKPYITYSLDSLAVEMLKQWEYLHGLVTATYYMLQSQSDETLSSYGYLLETEVNACFDEVKELTKPK
jgi:hypothetical protein